MLYVVYYVYVCVCVDVILHVNYTIRCSKRDVCVQCVCISL